MPDGHEHGAQKGKVIGLLLRKIDIAEDAATYADGIETAD